MVGVFALLLDAFTPKETAERMHHSEVGTTASILHYCSRDPRPSDPTSQRVVAEHFPSILLTSCVSEDDQSGDVPTWDLQPVTNHSSDSSLWLTVSPSVKIRFLLGTLVNLEVKTWDCVVLNVKCHPRNLKQRLDWTLGGWDNCTNYSALVFERRPKQSSGWNGIHSVHLSMIAEGVCFCCDDLS